MPGLAAAYDYGRPIENIDNEEDIYELYAIGDLSEEETERLVNLFQQKLDLNRATAAELFNLPGVTIELARAIAARRDQVGRYSAVEDLSSVPGMNPDVLMQVVPFVQVRLATRLKVPLTGSIKGKAVWTRGDTPSLYDPEDPESAGGSGPPSEYNLGTLPEVYLRFRGEVANRIKIGLVTSMDEGVDSFVYYPDAEAFAVTWGRPLFQLNSGYVMLEEPTWTAVVGNYAVGFGQHLVFDESRRLNPNGIYTSDEIYGSTSLGSPQRLQGVAATYRGFKVGSSSIELTGFVSRRKNDLYLYDFSLPNRTLDGESNAAYLCLDESCGTLNKITNITLPNVYTETLAGAHASFRLDKRTYLGLTGYWSFVSSDIPGLTFKAERPVDRSSFGAIGVDFGAALWKFQLDGEYALMDNLSQAFYLRSILDLGPGELLASFRSYGQDFDNPHSRGVSAADAVEQKRDRDETGFVVQASYRFNRRLSARAAYDQWYRPSLGVWRNAVTGRVDFVPVRFWDIGLVGTWRDKDLSARGRSRDYDSPSQAGAEEALETDAASPISGTSSEGDGARGTVGAQLSTRAIKNVWIDLYYKRTYQDAELQYYTVECKQPYGWLIGQDGWAKVRYSPWKTGSLTARVRYLDEDVYGQRGARALEGYLQYTQRFGKRGNVSLRYTMTRELSGHAPSELDYYCAEQTGVTLDDVAPTPDLAGHAVWLSFETRF